MEKRMEKTDYKITEFHNSEFGSIRMIEDGGRLLFSGIDVFYRSDSLLAHKKDGDESRTGVSANNRADVRIEHVAEAAGFL